MSEHLSITCDQSISHSKIRTIKYVASLLLWERFPRACGAWLEGFAPVPLQKRY